MQNGEVERLVADFLATRDITACPARYAALVEQRRRSALVTMRPYITATAMAVGLLAVWGRLWCRSWPEQDEGIGRYEEWPTMVRDLTKRGITAAPIDAPKGLAFEIADLILMKVGLTFATCE